MRKLLYLLLAMPLLAACMIGCTGKKASAPAVEPTPIDTVLADWDETNAPMPMLCIKQWDENYNNVISCSFRHVFESSEDSALFMPIADSYHTLVMDGVQIPVKFTGEQKTKYFGYFISGEYDYCMAGINYDAGGAKPENWIGFAFNDAFLQTHELIKLRYPDNETPRYLLDTLKTRYGMDVVSSHTCAESEDGKLAIYSVQMEPRDTACLGIRMVVDHDSIIIFEDPAYFYGQGSAWHVDDGDEYYPIEPIAVTRGAKGLDIFYYEGAPESSTFSAMLLRNGKIEEYVFTSYYNHVDFVPSPDPIELPEGSELKAELDGYRVWIHTDVEPTEDTPEGKYSVYYSEPNSNNVYFVVSTSILENFSEVWERPYNYVSDKEIMAASNAYIVKYGDTYPTYRLIIEGCPDMRNVFSYTTYLPISSIHPNFSWFRTNSGFKGMDQSGKLLMLDNYDYYEEGGRFTVRRYFDASSLDLVKEEVVEE